MGRALRFLKRHTLPAIAAVIGGCVTIAGYLLEARELVQLGLPIPVWQAMGAALFMGAMVTIIYRWDCEQHPDDNADRPEPTPVVITAPAARATTPAPARNEFGAWDHVDRFKVSEAANLWAGYLPSPSYLFDKGQRPSVLGAERLIASELKGALDMSEMPGYFTGDDYSSAYVARADLLALAEKKGVRPRFLYPNG